MNRSVSDATTQAVALDHLRLLATAALIWLTATIALFAQFHFYFGSPTEISWRWAAGDGFVWVIVIAICFFAYRAIVETTHLHLFAAAMWAWAIVMCVVGHPVLSVLLHWMLDGTLSRGFVGDTTHLVLKRLPQGIAIGCAIALIGTLSLKRATAPSPTESKTHFAFRDGSTLYHVPLRDIGLLEASGNYVAIHHDSIAPLARGSLAAVLEQLPADEFLRVSRKHAVGKAHVRKLVRAGPKSFEVELADGSNVPVSRSRFSVVKQALSELIS